MLYSCFERKSERENHERCCGKFSGHGYLTSGFQGNLRKIHCKNNAFGFHEFICLFHLLKFIDYRILRLPFESVACTFIFFCDKFSRNSCMHS